MKMFVSIFMPPFPSDSEVKIGKTTASAALVAVQTLKERKVLPDDFNLNIKFEDSGCNPIETLRSILTHRET